MFSNGYRKAPQDEDGGEHLEYNQSRPQPTASNEELPSTRCPGPFFFVSSVLVLVLMLTLALITWNGDLTPYESLERRMPHEFYTFVETPANKRNKVWESLEPERLGFIYIEHPERHGFPPGLPLANGQARKKYGLSWGHQLHCLSMIRDELHTYPSSCTQSPGGVNGALSDSNTTSRLHHIEHCFDYLRQAIQCASDMTIDWAVTQPNELDNPYHINGYGVQHRCRKLDDVYKYSADHRLPGTST